jgi:hypothetical protein
MLIVASRVYNPHSLPVIPCIASQHMTTIIQHSQEVRSAIANYWSYYSSPAIATMSKRSADGDVPMEDARPAKTQSWHWRCYICWAEHTGTYPWVRLLREGRWGPHIDPEVWCCIPCSTGPVATAMVADRRAQEAMYAAWLKGCGPLPKPKTDDPEG